MRNAEGRKIRGGNEKGERREEKRKERREKRERGGRRTETGRG